MIQIDVAVELEIDGVCFEELSGQRASWTGVERMDKKDLMRLGASRPDRFEGLNANGPAEVSIGVEQKLSGPRGTFSSTAISARVTVRCDQNEKAIDNAHNLAFHEAVRAVERYMGPAYRLLLDHTIKQE